MLIARKGNFGLITTTYIIEHTYTTHDIVIVKFYSSFEEDTEHSFVIAHFNEKGEIVSCGDRLLNEIEDEKDLEQIKVIAEIGQKIVGETENFVV